MPSVSDVTSRLTVDTRPFSKGIQTATRDVNSFGSRISRTSRASQRDINRLDRSVNSLSGTFKTLGGVAAAAFGLNQLGSFISDITSASSRVENLRLSFTSLLGSVEASNREFAFAVSEANRLGLEIENVAGSLRGLTAATSGSELAGSTREIFTNIAEAARKIGLNGEVANRVLLQIGQSATIGKIQTEELKIIAENGLPAFRALAAALKVPATQIDKIVQSGRAVSSRFLVPFVRELNKLAGSTKTFERFDTRIARLKNSFFLLSAALGDVLTQSDFVNDGIGALTDLFIELRGVIQGTGEASSTFGKLIVGAVTNVKSKIEDIGVAVGKVQDFRKFDKKFTAGVIDRAKGLFDKVKSAVGLTTSAEAAALDTIRARPPGFDAQAQSAAKPVALPSLSVSAPRIAQPKAPREPLVPAELTTNLKALDQMFEITKKIGAGFRTAADNSEDFLTLLEDKAGLVRSELEKSLEAGNFGTAGRTEALTNLLDGLQKQIDLEKISRQEQEATLRIAELRAQAEEKRLKASQAVKLSVETPLERFDRKKGELDSLGLDSETQGRALNQIRQELANTLPEVQALQGAFSAIGDTFGKTFTGIVQGTQSVGSAFKELGRNILLSIANAAIQSAISNIGSSLAGALGGSAGGGGIGGAIGGIVTGLVTGRAKGTVTNGEELARIGDNPGGREFVVPSQFLSQDMQRFLSRTIRAQRQLDTPSFQSGGIVGGGGGGGGGGGDMGVNLILVDDRDTAARQEKQFAMIDQRVMSVVIDDVNKGRGSSLKRRFEQAGR
jgi:tape measure domain-containing protein